MSVVDLGLRGLLIELKSNYVRLAEKRCGGATQGLVLA